MSDFIPHGNVSISTKRPCPYFYLTSSSDSAFPATFAIPENQAANIVTDAISDFIEINAYKYNLIGCDSIFMRVSGTHQFYSIIKNSQANNKPMLIYAEINTNSKTITFSKENTVQIDDTTPAIDKVYSSSKVSGELTSLNQAIETLSDEKISEPETEGTNGQVLTTDGNGGRMWTTVSGGDVTNKMDKNNPTGTGKFVMGSEHNMASAYGESFAIGYGNTVNGNNSGASGNNNTITNGQNSYVFGSYNESSSYYTFAEGYGNKTRGNYAHAEGSNNTASNTDAHAEGYNNTASGVYSHAEGCENVASGAVAHAEGNGTKAKGNVQHVQGQYNVEDTQNKYADIIGGGSSSARKNIETVDWNGNMELAGDVKANACGGQNPVSLLNVADNITLLSDTKANKSDSFIVSGALTFIPQNADLNTYRTAGTYACSDNAIFNTLSNKPTGAAAGKMIVEYGTGAAYYYRQTWFSYNGTIFTRWGDNNNYMNWVQITTQTILDDTNREIGMRLANAIRVSTPFANVASFIKYCRDTLRTESKLAHGCSITMVRVDGILSGGFFGTSSFNAICYFSSANYGWIHCWSDEADCGIVHIAINGNNAYIQKPTVTTTTVSLA